MVSLSSANHKETVKICSSGSELSLKKLQKIVTTDLTGATVTFLGTVRQLNRQREVTHLYYECYPEMLRAKAQQVIDYGREKFINEQPLNVACAFRTGQVEVGGATTAIATAARHRSPAFKTCRYLIDEFKQELPIWKKEHYEEDSQWIENKS